MFGFGFIRRETVRIEGPADPAARRYYAFPDPDFVAPKGGWRKCQRQGRHDFPAEWEQVADIPARPELGIPEGLHRHKVCPRCGTQLLAT